MLDFTKMRVAVLMGGPGSERPVSLASGEGVCAALAELGATVVPVDVTSHVLIPPKDVDIAFNVIHGTFGEDGELQELLERHGLPYTGEGVEGSRLAFDKILAKRRFVTAGIPTTESEVLRHGEIPVMQPPLVVKAPREGSSVGVYVVKNREELAPALEGAAKLSTEILVERFFKGRELTVGILGNRALPIVEIQPKEGFYDFKNKYPFLNPEGGATHYCPAALSPEETERVQATALAAHRALGLEVYSRVDVLWGEDGDHAVLEINTIPGMTKTSLLPEAAAAAGISYPELCGKIIELSLARWRETRG